MDIKIHCACGQKIGFDVEPENGAMPCSLPCPACQADVTALANEQIQKQLPAAMVPASGPAEAPRMRIAFTPTAHTPAGAAAGAVEAALPLAASAASTPGRSKPVRTPPAAPAQGDDGEATVGGLLLGTVGVFGGAIAGLVVWFLLAKLGLNLRVLAVLVGAGAGLGARVFCREGDKSLGGIAAMVAVIGMFMGGPLILDAKLRLSDQDLRESYQEAIQEAKQVVAATPNGTDAEITKYLGKDGGGTPEVTPEDIKEFRDSDEFKYARDLASGKRTYEAYAAGFRQSEDKLHKELGGAIAGFGAIRMLSLWLIALVGGTAYKLAAG